MRPTLQEMSQYAALLHCTMLRAIVLSIHCTPGMVLSMCWTSSKMPSLSCPSNPIVRWSCMQVKLLVELLTCHCLLSET